MTCFEQSPCKQSYLDCPPIPGILQRGLKPPIESDLWCDFKVPAIFGLIAISKCCTEETVSHDKRCPKGPPKEHLRAFGKRSFAAALNRNQIAVKVQRGLFTRAI